MIQVTQIGRYTMSSNLDVGPFSGGNIAVFQDVQSSGVAGTTVSTTLADQPLNTEVIAKSWASLSANQVTLDAGDYVIKLIDPQYEASTGGQGTRNYITDSSNNILS